MSDYYWTFQRLLLLCVGEYFYFTCVPTTHLLQREQLVLWLARSENKNIHMIVEALHTHNKQQISIYSTPDASILYQYKTSNHNTYIFQELMSYKKNLYNFTNEGI